jgi:hypothetical protein
MRIQVYLNLLAQIPRSILLYRQEVAQQEQYKKLSNY